MDFDPLLRGCEPAGKNEQVLYELGHTDIKRPNRDFVAFEDDTVTKGATRYHRAVMTTTDKREKRFVAVTELYEALGDGSSSDERCVMAVTSSTPLVHQCRK
jgi:hypothetical protein